MKRDRRLFVLLVFEIISLGAILISGFVSPKISNFFSFLSFAIFPLMIFVFLPLVYFILKKSPRAFMYILFILIAVVIYGPRLFQFSFKRPVYENNVLRVLSYNVGGFKQSVNPDELPGQLDEFFDFLKMEQIDVICFQEFSYFTKNIRKDLIELGYRDIMYKNPYNRKMPIRENLFVKGEYFDNEVITDGKSSVLGVKTKFVSGNDTLLFINTHIQSFNVKGLHPFKQPSVKKSAITIRNIIKNIWTNKSTQLNQIKILSESTASERRVIFCGDFNSMPSTYNYTWMNRHFNNGFQEAGNGFGFTYLGKTLFFLRIDHQFFKGIDLKCVEFEEIDFGFSDHKATYAKYVID